jgi:hypothetical protein
MVFTSFYSKKRLVDVPQIRHKRSQERLCRRQALLTPANWAFSQIHGTNLAIHLKAQSQKCLSQLCLWRTVVVSGPREYSVARDWSVLVLLKSALEW